MNEVVRFALFFFQLLVVFWILVTRVKYGLSQRQGLTASVVFQFGAGALPVPFGRKSCYTAKA